MAIKGIKRFRLQDVEPGMVLGKTVLDESGRVILEQGKVILQEGTLITKELLDRLLQWNIQVIDIQSWLPTPGGKTVNGSAKDNEIAELLSWMDCKDNLSVNMDRLAQSLGRKYPSDSVFVSLLEGQPIRWWVIASAGSFRLSDGTVEQKFKGQEYLAGQGVLIDELSLQKAPPGLARADIMSMCGVPILVDGVTVGAIEIFSRNATAFAAADVDRLTVCTRQAGTAVLCAKISEELRHTTEEKDLLHEIIGFVASEITVDQLLIKVADSLGNYFSASAVAAFMVQRLPQMNKANAVLARNFSRMDLETLKELFAKRWPATTSDADTARMPNRPPGAQSYLIEKFTAGRSIYMLPLFSRDLLQGIIVLMWEYERSSDFHSHIDDTLRLVAAQTALGIERQHLYSGVEKIGLTDALTGLANRRLFNYLIEREINRSRRYGRPVSLLMMDIDFFKRINDTWGHPAGDVVLRDLGALVRQSVRKLDVPVRYGGEEFAIILPETTLEEAVNLAERFRIMVERTVFSNGRERLPVTISIGIASIGNNSVADNMSQEEFLQMADSALYQAKQSGRNRIAVGRSQ
jgi:two-component system, cell cycle response regulator